jgi:serine/threonine protein kinase
MSLEQRRGEAVHQSWDLWALGVMTYEMVMGAFPFEDTSPGDWFAVGSVVPFTPVTKYMPEVSSGWQELFDQSFARDLSRRHESADAFLSDLQRLSS